MSAGDGPVGRREVAVRCFAAEYDDASLEYSEGDEERAPNYVVTPTGARINRLFVVGVLTEVESVSDDVLRGRVVDPTGAFVVYAGQYQPDAKAALERAETPSFVAVTGKARTFRPDDADRVYTSIRPESVNEVDAATRDRWTVQTAEQTLSRVSTAAAALEREERGEALTEFLVESGAAPALAAGIPRAFDHYGTTGSYLAAVRTLALEAAEVVAGEREEVDPLSLAPDEGGPADVDLAADVSLSAVAGGAAGPAGAPEPAGGEAGGDDRETVTADAETEPSADAAPDEEEPAVEAAGGDGAPGAEAEAPGEETPVEAGTDELYEMDDEEREAVEAEFGTEFETGNEVGEPGEADIETPEPDVADEGVGVDEATSSTGTEEADDGVAAGAEAEDGDDADGEEEPAEDELEGDLVDATVAAMSDLDEGDGAARDAVVESVVADRDVDEAAVEDAIDEALMEGRCYEPADGRLKSI